MLRGVLFFYPTCGHCRNVEETVLPPLQERYGEALDILHVDTRIESGYTLYHSACASLGISPPGVPFLVIGNQYLIGDVDIRDDLPALLDQAYARGGTDWPAIPGLSDYLKHTASGSPSGVSAPGILEHIGANLARDPVGNTFSIVVLAGMLFIAAAGALQLRRGPPAGPSRIPEWAVPALCLAGLGVAVYMAYVEIVRVEAVCGPVGDCNTVQQSSYTRLFGVLPMGVLGVIGYILILQVWIWGRTPSGRWRAPADLAVFGLSAAGFLFSIYLTFLEPFVIGASCSWCLASAVLMTALFTASLSPAKAVLTGPSSDAG